MRITKAILKTRIKTLNEITGNSVEPIVNKKWVVGSFCLDSAYGGFSLEKIANEAGAVTDMFHLGHVPAKVLKASIDAFIEGIMYSKDQELKTVKCSQ